MDEDINWKGILEGKVYKFGETKIEFKEGRNHRVSLQIERALRIEDVLSYRVVNGEVRFITKDGNKYNEVLTDIDPLIESVDKKRKPSTKRRKYERRSH